MKAEAILVESCPENFQRMTRNAWFVMSISAVDYIKEDHVG